MIQNQLHQITIRNKNNMQATLINFGATITHLWVPDKKGKSTDVIVGLKNLEDYIKEAYAEAKLFLGASIGRYAGRISNGSFSIGDKLYHLTHDHGVHLHGGKGFDKKY